MNMELIWLALGGALVVGVGFYVYMEYQAYLVRTEVSSVAGGIRFTAQNFTVESRTSDQVVLVSAKSATYKTQPLSGGEEQSQTGPMTVRLTAPGLQIKVSRVMVRQGGNAEPKPSGVCTIVLQASDELLCKLGAKKTGERSVLRLDRVPDPVALAFKSFSGTLEVWVEKLEHNLAAELAEREKRAREEAEKAAKEAAKAQAPVEELPDPKTPQERQERAQALLAQWRDKAGFVGAHTEMAVNQKGGIDWLIDLCPDGRVLLHANKRTFSGSLKGAVVTLLSDELEVAVRDDFWQADDPRLAVFKVLRGLPVEGRQQWKRRLQEAMENFQENPGSQSQV